MKASELRIGNYVFCPEIGDTFTDRDPYLGECIFSINQINTWGIRVNIGHDAVQKLNFDESIEPILLTEEWMVKFGFEYNGFQEHGKEYFKTMADGFLFCIELRTEHCCYITGENNIGEWDIITDIQYVHQLQNLYFALTCEELKL